MADNNPRQNPNPRPNQPTPRPSQNPKPGPLREEKGIPRVPAPPVKR